MSKKEILKKELDAEQLSQVTGGLVKMPGTDDRIDDDQYYCYVYNHRPQYDCAATVEKGSYCRRNDACHASSVNYDNCWRAESNKTL